MSPDLIEKIESFLVGDIDRNELETFAQEQSISDLEEKINWVKNSHLAVEAAGLQNQLQTLFGAEEKKEVKVRKLGVTKKSWAAAAAVLILVSGFWVFNKPSHMNLYAKYQYKDTGLPVVMGQSEDYTFDDAMTYFTEENYKEAAAKFGALNKVIQSDTLSYYLGVSLSYSDNVETAKTHLNEVAKNINSTFKEKAEWALVLADLKEKNWKAVRLKLAPIIENDDHQFYTQAKELLSKIPSQ
jgi:TolA-binding protein